MKPILFNTKMVRAILSGRKTCTRRIVKPQPAMDQTGMLTWKTCQWMDGGIGFPASGIEDYAPFRVGDVLYVRETCYKDAGRYMYRADYSDSEKFFLNGREIKLRWTPSIHMPKEAARIFLLVDDVRLQRLQYMIEDDAYNEGYTGCQEEHTVFFPEGGIEICTNVPGECRLNNWYCNHSVEEGFGRDIWDATVLPAELDRYGWDANPWVWVIDFHRIGKEEAIR